MAAEIPLPGQILENGPSFGTPAANQLRQNTWCRVVYAKSDRLLAIRERLAESDPRNARWQVELAGSYSNIGEVLRDQGDLAGALKSYRDSLAVTDRLATSDPGNSQWQADLANSFNDIGLVLRLQGDLSGALKSHRDGLAIRERLAAADPGNAVGQHHLATSFNNIGSEQAEQGDLSGGCRRGVGRK